MEMQQRINNYWSKRADGFSACRVKDMEGSQRKIWTDIITDVASSRKGLRALDVGTGAGFYSFLLADMGFEVTGVDYSQNMIDNAIANSKNLGYKDIKFIKMDAQDLKFEDCSFDLIISRNVTWTLPDPKKAYAEWCRVLAPGGKIVNFDANYGHDFKHADEIGQAYKEMQNWTPSTYNRIMQSKEMIRERNDISKQLYISNFIRPQWDVDILIQNNISKITVDMQIGRRVYVDMLHAEGKNNDTIDSNNKYVLESEMFMVCACKNK